MLFLILAAVAVPVVNYWNTAANEVSAQQDLRAFNASCIEYSLYYGGFPSSIAELTSASLVSSTSINLINSDFSRERKNGYRFIYEPGQIDKAGHAGSYTIRAIPLIAGKTGRHTFITTQAGIVRIDAGADVAPGSSPRA